MSPLPLIIGHRGASAHAPENTLAALNMAIMAGADGVEFDVRLASDGVPVVIHDADLRRVARRDTAVSQLTSAELGCIDVGSWFNSAFPGKASPAYSDEAIPTLERVLGLVPEITGPVYVELKSDIKDSGQLVRACCKLLCDPSLLPKIIVKSFDLEALKQIRYELLHVKTAALFEPGVKTVFRRRANLVDMAAECGAGHISLHWSLVNRRLIEAAKNARMPVTVWTVEHPRWIEKAREMGISSLITNDPAKLLGVRDGSSPNLRNGL
ncbi:glycerophosphodiester phosphodiesterase family protein [soil metagenome]